MYPVQERTGFQTNKLTEELLPNKKYMPWKICKRTHICRELTPKLKLANASSVVLLDKTKNGKMLRGDKLNILGLKNIGNSVYNIHINLQ